MNIPEDWLEEIYAKVGRSRCLPSRNEEVRSSIKNIIDMQLNKGWVLQPSLHRYFKDFFIKIISHQTNPFTHMLTCGVNSKHSLLLPRISDNHTLYLVCPTCGWIQLNVEIK